MGTTAIMSCAIACVVTWLVRSLARRRGLLDRPNGRSAHIRPTPRLGGIGILIAFLAGTYVALVNTGATAGALAVIAATAAVSLVGLIDDVRPLSARIRLGAQALAAVAVIGFNLGQIDLAWNLGTLPRAILLPASILWMVWVTNLYNFMDGIDGLAGGQAVVAGAAISAAAFGAGSYVQGALALVLAASASGFLIFNLAPASIFMGDVGSTAIGFLFAALPFVPGGGGVPIEAIAIVLSLFILDATTTLVRRIVRGERLFEAHRTHLYQRPLAFGTPHSIITAAVFPGMLAVGVCGALYGSASTAGRRQLVAVVVTIFASYAAVVLRMERRRRAVQQTSL